MRRMQGDGNCLFRCFSNLLTGSQEHHFLVRTLICNYMRHIDNLLMFVLPSGDVLDHLRNSNMTNNFVWGTDIEIYAFAHMCQTNVYLFCESYDTWALHSRNLSVSHMDVTGNSVYLYHPIDHYDVVCSVRKT